MPKKKKQNSTGNITKERLAGTPFNSMSEMSEASQELRRETWNQLEKARIKRELLQKPEYKFFLEPFRKGMVCKYGEQNDTLVRVSLTDEGGIAVDINEEMKSEENSGAVLNNLIKATSDSLFSNYLKSMDIISHQERTNDSEIDIVSNKKHNKKK